MKEKIEETLESFERKLHDFEVRKDRDVLNSYLHDQFIEIGRSGVIYSREDIINEFSNTTEFPKIFSENYKFVHISETTILLTYRSAHLNDKGKKTRITLRSSIWQLKDGSWKILFHQGTPENET